jgi:formylmethanofuran dehydrogenase subunit C
LRFTGAVTFALRPGQFVDVETATGARERAGVVLVAGDAIDVEVSEIVAGDIVRIAGPYDSPR